MLKVTSVPGPAAADALHIKRIFSYGLENIFEEVFDGEVFDDGADIFEEVFDDGENIFEEVFDDGEDIFEEVFDDGENIFEEVSMMVKTSLKMF